jgi:hypothetical protein
VSLREEEEAKEKEKVSEYIEREILMEMLRDRQIELKVRE